METLYIELYPLLRTTINNLHKIKECNNQITMLGTENNQIKLLEHTTIIDELVDEALHSLKQFD